MRKLKCYRDDLMERMKLKTQISDKNVNFLKRQEGMESRHRWKDATTILIILNIKLYLERKYLEKLHKNCMC